MKVASTASIAALAGATAATSARHCCGAFAADDSLRSKVYMPDSAVYDAQLKSYYSANAAQHAWCMVLPESTEDVQKIARAISDSKCPFGVRSGGHSTWKGSNGVERGVTIDFSYMNGTTYDEKAGIAKIQPGARWGSVYESLNPHNVTVVGARTSVVGVGGFVTGAGYSFHSNEHGFSCDMVENWEIVLANGTVVNANANENADLWKAQKGGSGNLGFVTRIDQITIPGTQLWGGFTQYELEERDKVFDAYVNFVDNTEENSPDQNIIALFWDNKDGFALRSILTNANGEANRTAFKEYLALPNIGSTLTSGPESEIIPQFTGPTPLGEFANWFTGTAKHSFKSLAAIDELHHELIPKMRAAAPNATFSTLVELQPLTHAMVSHAAKRGGNVLGLETVIADGPKLNWLFSLTVDTAEHQEALLPLAQDFIHTVNHKQRSLGTYVPWIYLNYAWAHEEPYPHYGAENTALLADVSAAYDPDSVFQKLRDTGFKLVRQ